MSQAKEPWQYQYEAKRDKWRAVLDERLRLAFPDQQISIEVRGGDAVCVLEWHGVLVDRCMGWGTGYEETYLKYSLDRQMKVDIQEAIRDVREYMAAHPE